jgi:hypothetical protein
VIVGFIAALEGAFVLCRAQRTTEALEVAERLVIESLRHAQGDRTP